MLFTAIFVIFFLPGIYLESRYCEIFSRATLFFLQLSTFFCIQDSDISHFFRGLNNFFPSPPYVARKEANCKEEPFFLLPCFVLAHIHIEVRTTLLIHASLLLLLLLFYFSFSPRFFRFLIQI